MNVTNTTVTIGKAGESYVVNYLKEKGFTILEQNFRFHHDEIDIIASNSKFIVFVEVKTRKENSFTQPWEAVTKAKQQRIIKAAYGYLLQHKSKLQPRFDVAEVIVQNDTLILKNINYIENAFWQGGAYARF